MQSFTLTTTSGAKSPVSDRSELKEWSAVPEIPVSEASALRDFPGSGTQKEAASQLLDCYRQLRKGGQNVVGEILRGQGTFYEMDHYPEGDVYDEESHSQYYYHSHREALEGLGQEHGHFHTFLRAEGMPGHCRPVPLGPGAMDWPEGDEALSHLIAIAMDKRGYPVGLFATNRWVTGDCWYPAEQVIQMLDVFRIDHSFPNLVVNHWLSAMVRLYRPHIESLLYHRDKVVESWQQNGPSDVLEDRTLEVTGYLAINSEAYARELLASRESSS